MGRSFRVVFLLLSASCATGAPDRTQIPNPASQYCLQAGGKHEVQGGPAGQTGYCRLPDGRLVDEWEFYRRAHP